MSFTERDLQKIIYENHKHQHGVNALLNRGLSLNFDDDNVVPYKIFSELKIGKYGRSDIVVVYRSDNHLLINIVELKSKSINVNTLVQCARYAKGIKEYLRDNVSLSDWIYLTDILSTYNLKIFTCEYDYNGISFEERYLDGYALDNSGFHE